MSIDASQLTDTLKTDLVSLEGGETLQMTKLKNQQYRTAPYFCIGRKGYTSFYDHSIKERKFTEGLDVTSIFLQLKPTTLAIFWKLVSLRDSRTNIVNLAVHDFNETDKNRLKKCRSELKEHQLVCDIKRGYLLINPKAIIPEYSYYESVELRWKQLNIDLHSTKCKIQNQSNSESVEQLETLKLSLSSAGMMTTPIEFDDEEDEITQTPPKNLKRTLTF